MTLVNSQQRTGRIFNLHVNHRIYLVRINASAPEFSKPVIRRMKVSMKVERNDSTVYWASESLQNRISDPDEWIPFNWNLTLPTGLAHTGDKIIAGIWNLSQHRIFTDDLHLRVVRFRVGEKVNYFPE